MSKLDSAGEELMVLTLDVVKNHGYDIGGKALDGASWFREWFVRVVSHAEKHWNRPDSVFQHIGKILVESGQSRREHDSA